MEIILGRDVKYETSGDFNEDTFIQVASAKRKKNNVNKIFIALMLFSVGISLKYLASSIYSKAILFAMLAFVIALLFNATIQDLDTNFINEYMDKRVRNDGRGKFNTLFCGNSVEMFYNIPSIENKTRVVYNLKDLSNVYSGKRYIACTFNEGELILINKKELKGEELLELQNLLLKHKKNVKL